MNSTIQARYPQHSIIKGGILAKRGRGQFIKPWSLRTIIIDQNKQLFYYDRDVLKGTVDLEGTTIRYLPPNEADGRENAFEIMNISNVKATQDRSLILAATSLKEAEEWVDVLMNSATVSSSSKIFLAEYESLQSLSKNIDSSQPIDLKKLKESRKKKSQEALAEFEVESS